MKHAAAEYTKALLYGFLSVLSLGVLPSYYSRSVYTRSLHGSAYRISVNRGAGTTPAVSPLLADLRKTAHDLAVGITRAKAEHRA